MSLSVQINPNWKPGSKEFPVIMPDSIFPLPRLVGCWLSPVVIRLPLSANQVTFVSMLIGLIGCTMLLFGDIMWNIAGAVCLFLSYALDYCDGIVARLKNQCSPYGAAFDDFVDFIVDTAIFACLGYGTWVATDNMLWFWLGFIAAAGSTVDYIVDWFRANRFKQAREAEEKAKEPEPEEEPAEKTFKDKLFYYLHTMSRAEFCTIILVLSMLDVVWILLPFGAIGAQAFWIGDLFRKRD